MMIVIETQIHENYAWDEDGNIGTGLNAYWKSKGGQSFKILNVPSNVDLDEVVSMVRDDIEKASDYYMEAIVSYGMEKDDWISWYEKSQLEYDGEVQFPDPTIEYNDLISEKA